MTSAYLDYYSSTPVLPEVLEAMRPYWEEVFASPSALHQQGLRVRDALAVAREQVAGLIHASSPEEILFTSGGTESANLAVKGVAWANERRGRHVVVSATEHPAVLRSVEFLERRGFDCTRVGVDGEGWVDPGAVKAAITDRTILVCVHHVNHDLGTVEPVGEVGEIARAVGVPLFVDATASGGWMEVDVEAMGISLLSLSPHRFYGPKGVGVLYRNRRVRLESVLHGGLQEWERRAGTENVAGIVGAGVAAERARLEMKARQATTGRLQARLWAGIRQGVPYVRLNGPELGPKRLPTNLNLSVEFVEGEGLALMCDVQGIAIGSGASCVSRALKASPVLEAIGLDRSLAQANVILSLGRESQDSEADYFLEVFPKVVQRLRDMSPQWEAFQRGTVRSQLEPGGR